MIRKSEIDKHVAGILYKVKNENERNLRCFHIAKLYHKIQDYDSVQRYINMYLSACDDSAAAHKLLGQALEGLGQKEKALAAYTKSLKLDPDQSDLVFKVCELLCDKNVEFDPARARYWSERASLLFPHSLPVLMLKEKLLTTDSSMPLKDLEELLHAELRAKPTDVSVRIKLLKTYAESGRSEMALSHAFEVESRLTHINCFAWYQCVTNICKAHNRDHIAKCDWEFYVQWLTALDRMCLLSVTENMSYSCDLSEAIDCVLSLDQALNYAHVCPVRTDKFGHFLKLMSAQLAYFIGILLIKKAKKEGVSWKEIKRLMGPLFIMASNTPFKLDEGWTINLKETLQKVLDFWVNSVHCRQVQSGYLLQCLVKENHSEKMFLDKVSHFTAGDWRQQIYKKVFSDSGDANTSHFLSGSDYTKFPLKVPSSNSLKPTTFVSCFENTYFGSLHYLVWLGLRSIKKTSSVLDIRLHTLRTTSFKSLQYTINNLNNVGVETLNQLDVDSFFYITVLCTASILEEGKTNGYSNEEKPQVLPADVSSPLCTAEQAKWWSNLCLVAKGGPSQLNSNESLSDLRFSLQRGLEVVRGEGLPPLLIVALARTFATRGTLAITIEETDGCKARALHLWHVAYPLLERLVSNKPYFATPKINSLFEFPIKTITPQEAKPLLEEAKYNIGCNYYYTRQYEKAIEELKGLKTPQAIYQLGMVYLGWANHQIDGIKVEELTSEIRCRNAVLITKARECFLESKALLKHDPKHQLRPDIDRQLEEVKDLLARIEPENGVTETDANGTSGTPSYGSGGSADEVVHMHLHTSNQRSMRYHTSTPHRIHEEKANRFNMAEIIELLTVQQSTNQLKMQQVIEQIRLVSEKLDSIATEQRMQRNLIDGQTTRLNTFESEMKSSISDIKKDMKRPDLCNVFEDDDYTDEMMQYPGYSQYYAPTQRVVQNAAAPPTVPFVNQYFSPRIDPLCQGFYNQQGALPFSEGQQLPDFLRQQKVGQSMLHSLQTGIPPQLNLATMPGPSRVPTGPSIPSNVLLTTADTIPTGASPVVAPPLTVNIPTSRVTTSAAPNAPHNFQIPLPPQPKPVLNIEEREVEEETPPPTYDPLPDFKPLVPLPDEIEVHTGEEDEEVLFEKKTKLFRYVEKLWKERGTGIIKILKNKTTGKIRILMRRDQVHKICANHILTADMELVPKANTENAWVWFANDFADEKIQVEKFCAKFKTKDDSDEFKNAFDKAKEDLGSSRDNSVSNQTINQSTDDEPTTPQPTSMHSTFSTAPVTQISVSKPSFTEAAPVFSTGSFGLGLSPSTATGSRLFSNFSTGPVLTGPFSSDSTTIGSGSFPKFSVSSNPAFTSSTFLTSSSNVTVSSTNSFPTDPKGTVISPASNSTSFSSAPTTAPSAFSSSTFNFSQAFTPSTKPPVSSEKTEEQKLPSSTGSTVQPSKIGGFTFSLAKPKFKAPEISKDDVVKETKQPSPFANFNFGISGDPPKNSFSGLSNLSNEKKTDLPNPFAITSSTKSSVSSSQVKSSDSKKDDNDDEKDTPKSPSAKDEGEVDSFVPTATFQPVIPLPDLIAVKTGEENEEIIFEDRAQLYRFCRDTKQWKERGTGQMKILKHPETGSYRLLMRREQVFKVCCNHRITNDITLKPLSSSDKAFSWAAKDHSEEPPTDELFSLKFKSSEQAMKFKEAFEKCQSNLKNSTQVVTQKPNQNEQPLLSSLLKKPPGSWECNSCYVSNKAEDLACKACNAPNCKASSTAASQEAPKSTATQKENKEPSLAELLKPKPGTWECNACYTRNQPQDETCVACSVLKPGCVAKETEAKVTPTFSFGMPAGTNIAKVGTGNVGFSALSSTSFTFGMPPTGNITSNESSTAPETNKFTFGNSGGFNFGGAPSVPFEKSSQQIGTTKSEITFGSSTFQFSLPISSVASPPGNTSQHDESGYDPEEEEEDHVQFQPVVPLPDKIDVVTGEENEIVLYSQRAKLFRFEEEVKEWKERGVGDVKILQHKETGKIRLLMRREPVMKVCLNHVLTPDIALRIKDEKSWIWYAVDFSEGTQKSEKFAIRFKSPDIAQVFKDEVDKAKVTAEAPPSSTVIKQDEESVKDSTEVSSTSSDNDVVFISEQKAPPELVAKAISLQLPANYYCYLDKPKCPGCRGCESDEENEETGHQENPPEKSSEDKGQIFSKNLFGSASTTFTPSPTHFTFAQAFSTPNEDKKTPVSTQKGFFFNQESFTSMTPEKNIFSSGGGTGTPGFLANTSNLQSFSSLSAGSESFVQAGENHKWEGAGQPVFGQSSQKKQGKGKPDSGNK